jgi:hypothetical protein
LKAGHQVVVMPDNKRIARVKVDNQGRIHGKHLVVVELNSFSNLRVMNFNAKAGMFIGILTLTHKETQYGLLETEVQYCLPILTKVPVSIELSTLDAQLTQLG